MLKSKPVKYILLGFAILVLLAAMFYLGFYWGSKDQFRLRTLQNITDTAKTATALEGLRRGHNDASINLLESQLDLYIINHALLLKTGDKPSIVQEASVIMKSVAKYRAEYPSSAKGDTLKLIEDTLEIYRE